VVAIVQQNRIGRTVNEIFSGPDAGVSGQQMAGKRTRISTRNPPRRVAQQLKKFETQTLAALRLRRADRQISGCRKMPEAPGVDDPEGEDGSLLRSAREIPAQEAGCSVGDAWAFGFGLTRGGRGRGDYLLQVGAFPVHTWPA